MKRIVYIIVILIIGTVIVLWMTRKRVDPRNLPLRFVSLAWQEATIATNKSIVSEWNKAHSDLKVEYIQGPGILHMII